MIREGDMTQESADGLNMVVQRVMGGGALTDQEREMFSQVIRAMPAGSGPQMDMPEGQGVMDVRTYMVDGQPVQMTPQQYENAVRSGEITQDEMSYTVDGKAMAATPMQMSDMRKNMGAMSDAEVARMRPKLRPRGSGSTSDIKAQQYRDMMK